MSEEETITPPVPMGADAFNEILEQVQEEFRDDSEPEDESEESSEDYDSPETTEIEEEEGDDNEAPAYFNEDSDEEETEEDEETSDAEAEEEQEDVEPEGEQPSVSSDISEMQEKLQAALGMLDQQREFNGQLVEKLKTHEVSLQGQRQQPAPERSAENQQLEEAFRLSLFGTADDKETYESLSPTIKKKAKDAVQRYSQEETLNILYPEKRYAEKIRYFVMQDIQKYVQQAMGGLNEDFNARKAEDVFSKYEGEISSTEERQRLLEVMDTIPGHNSDDWQVQEKVLDLAVQQVVKERKEEDLVTRERELDMRERQLKQSGPKRSGAKGKRGRRRTRSQASKMKSGDDMLEFARTVEKEIRNGR